MLFRIDPALAFNLSLNRFLEDFMVIIELGHFC